MTDDTFNVTYLEKSADGASPVVVFRQGCPVLTSDLRIPNLSELRLTPEAQLEYLFELSGTSYYLAYSLSGEALESCDGLTVLPCESLKHGLSASLTRILTTALHMHGFLSTMRCCSRCAGRTEHIKGERALRCVSCGRELYPVISPAVIVLIKHDGRALLARGKHYGAAYFSLIAGYCEIGESLEETVAREVLEETNLRVRDIRYYKSLPWGISGALMTGFTAELDCPPEELRRCESELTECRWFTPSEIPEHPSSYSLGADMMRAFKNGEL